MSGLILLFILGAWFFIAKSLSSFLTTKMQMGVLKQAAQVLLFALILVAPVADEIIGALIFKSECEALPPVKFYGAASIGEGYFFDSNGKPKWTTDKEFEAMTSGDQAKNFHDIVKESEAKQIIRKYPIEIEMTKHQYYGGQKHELILESTSLISYGGWIRDWIRGLFGFISCQSKGSYPKEDNWIKF